MTKPATPPRNQVVEIEAMDVAEWESGQRTPQAPDANLAELVRKTAPALEPPARVQTVARDRTRIQLGAPVIRPPNRARTEPPGPPPKPARARTSGGGPAAPSARATRVPDIPAGPPAEPRKSPAPMTRHGLDFSPVAAPSETRARQAAPEPRRSLTPTPVGGVDFSLPVTATSPGMPAAPEPRRSLTQTPVGGVDFSLPVTATGGAGSRPSVPEPQRSLAQTPVGGVDFSLPVTATTPALPEPPAMRPLPAATGGTGFSMPAVEHSARPPSEPRPRSPASSGTDGARTATASSDSGARPPDLEPRPPTPAPPLAWPPRVDPGPGASPFAERSHVGPGLNASPAGGAGPNTAWPPRPVPVDPSSPPPPAAPDPAIQRSQLPDRDAGGPDRLKIGLSRRRLWWIGGGIVAASLAAIIAAVVLPGPDAQPQASEPAGAPSVQATGSRRDPRSEQPADRAAADLRERVRLAREAAAAGVPMTPPVDPPPMRHAPTDPSAWIRSDGPESGAPHPGKKHRLVVDYSARPNEPAPPSLVAQSEEDPAIGRARTAYTAGNQRLFAGDLDGAVRAYREALEIYPGYVGGYRGLGLAYQQLGDKLNALAALQAYVEVVPKARDIALIKKRIARLQRR
jgi:hypothetical protein